MMGEVVYALEAPPRHAHGPILAAAALAMEPTSTCDLVV